MDQFKVLKIPAPLYDRCAEIAKSSGVETDDMLIGLISSHADFSEDLFNNILHTSPIDKDGNPRDWKPKLDVDKLEQNAKTIEDCMIDICRYLDSTLQLLKSARKVNAARQG